jgi:hypothetical protein
MARGLRGRSRPLSAARAGSLVLGCLLALGACGGRGPGPGDVRPEAYLLYPGAEEVGRHWRSESKGRSVDGSDLSHPARMTVRIRLAEPVPNAAVWQWYDEQLGTRGWDRRPQVSASHAEFTRQVGGRRHTIDVEAGSDEATPDAELSVHYTIGYADDWRPG